MNEKKNIYSAEEIREAAQAALDNWDFALEEDEIVAEAQRDAELYGWDFDETAERENAHARVEAKKAKLRFWAEYEGEDVEAGSLGIFEWLKEMI